MEIQQIPLSNLMPSRHNSRKTGGTRIEDLAASIRHNGLIQNLTVIPNGKPDHFEVIAGYRRLLALRSLNKDGAIASDYLVPCVVADKQRAGSVSLAENTIREAMHPVDEFEAFKELADSGLTVDEIATQFGTSPLKVEQRLRLARVSPVLLQLCRDGQMTVECLKAYAITEDQQAQEAHWNNANQWQRTNPHGIRSALTGEEIDASRDRRALFVGLDAYESAGGIVRRDLFGGPTAGYLASAQLLDQLCTLKLRDEADKVRMEGWSFVEIHEDFSYDKEAKFGRSHPQRRKSTPEEQAQIEALESTIDRLRKLLQTRGDDEELSESEADEFDRAEEQLEQLKGLQQTWSDSQKAKSGAVVALTQSGTLRIERGLVRGGSKSAKSSPKSGPVKHTAGETGEPVSAKLSAALVQRLTARRSAAIALELARNPRQALLFATHAMALRTFYSDSACSALRIHITANANELKSRDPGLVGTEADLGMRSLHDTWTGRIPAEPEKLLGVLQSWAKEVPERIGELLAYCAAQSVSVLRDDEASAVGDRVTQELSQALAVDMRKYWRPTVDEFFGSVRKSRVLDAMTEAGFENQAIGLHLQKSGFVASQAEVMLAKSNWLPEILRTEGINSVDKKAVAYSPTKKAKAAKPAKAKPGSPIKPAPKAKRPAPTAKKAARKQLPAKKAATKAKPTARK